MRSRASSFGFKEESHLPRRQQAGIRLPKQQQGSNNTDLSDLLCPSEAVLLKVIGQVQKGASLQIVAVTEDDQETLLLHTNHKDL